MTAALRKVLCINSPKGKLFLQLQWVGWHTPEVCTLHLGDPCSQQNPTSCFALIVFEA